MSDRPSFLIGIDLGQVNDYTALAVIEQTRKQPHAKYDYAVTHLDRWRGVSYPEGTARTAKVLTSIDGMRSVNDDGQEVRPNMRAVVDQTGVGRPVVDLLRAEKMPVRLAAITITGGDTYIQDGIDYRVPKRDLAGIIAVLLQTGRLKIAADMPLAETLVKELTSFRVKVSATGHDSYGNGTEWRDADHDDLVLAVALALWYAEVAGKRSGIGMAATVLGTVRDKRNAKRLW